MQLSSSGVGRIVEARAQGQMQGVERMLDRPSVRAVLNAVREQLAQNRLSDEDGRRLVAALESILRELSRLESRARLH